ncbi:MULTISPECIES: sensor histidine kinase [Pseudonocardia]|uniref:histidine kinase n=2 Tax=Pseudonocardia TaxID=1847 RepID=A0A1Y2NAA6_PSEAH|nr:MULTISPECIES: histidine kinase [Pseudonocardia]OSY44007.1 Sensor histidine kinase LiaS [Pseudonocardia autotrophica]TDN74260.1 signal transduction histidine kinase [Pseudonocardia autotrophica]BBG05024.1 two-component sensor histidine kinase [Pseudonocardia autotrophica]GEC28358.1 two-component sensor histidine kinase [Pseudonocardia saturnea]
MSTGTRRGRLALAGLELLLYLFWAGCDVVLGLGFGSGGWQASGAVFGLLVGTIVLIRYRPDARRQPIAAVAFGLSALGSVLGWITGGLPFISLTEMFALAVITVATVRIAPVRVVVVTAAVSLVVIVGMPLMRVPTNDSEVFASLTTVGWAGTMVVATALRELWMRRSAQLAQTRNDERLELARELHDTVAHHVTAIVVAAQAGVVVAGSRPEEAGRALESIERAGAEALDGMRRMVGVLRSGPDGGADRAPGHGLDDIDDLVGRFDPTRTRARLEISPEVRTATFGPAVAATAFRVVREALTNVHRHAPGATAVSVGLHLQAGRLVTVVHNDGIGTDNPLRDPGGFGLAGMRERVEALGGSLHAGPDGPGRWIVVAEVPAGGGR